VACCRVSRPVEYAIPAGEAAMTQQYLAGEVSLLLAQLQSATSNQACLGDVTHLRWRTETGPLAALSSIVVQALELADGLCWDSLHRGDTPAFGRQAEVCADLREFGACANLLDE
jgi:hypothetical protein